MRKLKSRLTFGLVVLASLLLVACGGSESTRPEGAAKFTYQIKAVDVQYGKSLAGEKTSRLDSLNGKSILTSELQAMLRSSGKFNGAVGRDVKVTVTNFRLRSWASAFWLGIMGGVDSMDVSADVVEDGRVVKTLQTGVAASRGGWINASPEKRFRQMAELVSFRVMLEL